ncbi:MAG: protocatechuate 4,5-dioxygenase subunit alpha [Ilumatobacteraceae bacterium]
MSLSREYRQIEGTVVQDGSQSRMGYRLNQCLYSLRHEANRRAFADDEGAYLAAWNLTAEQRDAVVRRDWSEMLRLGGNMFYLMKLAAHEGRSVQHVASHMSGTDEESFRQMMIAGGRRPTRAEGAS